MRRRFEPVEITNSSTMVEETITGHNHKKDINKFKLPQSIGFCFIFVQLLLLGGTYFLCNTLPTPVTLKDQISKPTSFNSERAYNDLRDLTAHGPRVAGSNINEIFTVNFLKQRIKAIINEANKKQYIELLHQVSNQSSFLLGSHLGSVITSYSDLQNLIVIIHSNNISARSLVINTHFDSVPTSPGGSDNGINCVTSLEILRILSKSNERPRHNIVFLFNGAEETGLQASHAFCSQHPWAKRGDVVINLDAAGAGGKIALFQTGPETPWLLDYYAKVPLPNGNVAGEEIFQSNVIPSDTDFRIFRDFCGYVGFDMAFIKDGYRYHTKYDGIENIPWGSFQHVGDVVLSLVTMIANSSELGDRTLSKGKTVYYDLFGFFMINYTEIVGIVINVGTCIFSCLVYVMCINNLQIEFNGTTLKFLALTVILVLSGWIFATIITLIIAYLVDKVHCSMSWYRTPWLLLGLYSVPVVLCISIPLPFLRSYKFPDHIKSQLQVHSVRLLWTIVIVIGTIANVRTVYTITILVLFNAISFCIIHILGWQFTARWIFVCAVLNILPSALLMYNGIPLFGLIIPITGRMGSSLNPDLIIGSLILLFTTLIMSPLVPTVTVLRRTKYLFITLVCTFILSLIFVLMRSSIAFPYNGTEPTPTPQRFWILHVKRLIHDDYPSTAQTQDAGYYLVHMDRNSPFTLENYIGNKADAVHVNQNCTKYLLCGYPLPHPKMTRFIPYSTWIPTDDPNISTSVQLNLLSKKQFDDSIDYNIMINGSDRVVLLLSTKSGINFTSFSLLNDSTANQTLGTWNNRSVYFITYLSPKSTELIIHFTVSVPKQFLNETTTEFAICGIYVHDKFNKTEKYVQFLNKFPNWADITAWLASYETGFI